MYTKKYIYIIIIINQRRWKLVLCT